MKLLTYLLIIAISLVCTKAVDEQAASAFKEHLERIVTSDEFETLEKKAESEEKTE